MLSGRREISGRERNGGWTAMTGASRRTPHRLPRDGDEAADVNNQKVTHERGESELAVEASRTELVLTVSLASK